MKLARQRSPNATQRTFREGLEFSHGVIEAESRRAPEDTRILLTIAQPSSEQGGAQSPVTPDGVTM